MSQDSDDQKLIIDLDPKNIDANTSTTSLCSESQIKEIYFNKTNKQVNIEICFKLDDLISSSNLFFLNK